MAHTITSLGGTLVVPGGRRALGPRLRITLAPVISALLLQTATPARAQGNMRSTPTGGRSALMGGTGVALSRDASAPFLNPATIAEVSRSRVAFSFNFYRFSQVNLQSWFRPGPVNAGRFGSQGAYDASVSTVELGTLPNTVCVFAGGSEGDGSQPGGRFAVCLGQTETADLGLGAENLQTSVGPPLALHAQYFQMKWNRTHVGPTFGTHLTERLAVGASAHAILSSYGTSYAASTVAYQPNGEGAGASLNLLRSGRSLDLAAILGATYRVTDAWTVGVAVHTPSLHLWGRHNGSYANFTVPPGSAAVRTEQGSASAPLPPRVSLGVGYEGERFRGEVDTFFSAPLAPLLKMELTETVAELGGTSVSTRLDQVTRVHDARPVVNFAAGGEYFVTSNFSVLGGVSTDLTPVAPFRPQPQTYDAILSRLSRVGASAGVGSYGESGDLLFGFDVSYGWGTLVAPNLYATPPELAYTKQSGVQVLAVIAGSATIRSLKRTLDQVEKAVTPKK